MNYEEKYKEALDKFKKFKEKYFTYGRMEMGDVLCDKTGTAHKEFNDIFPELQSKDELIRQQLVRIVKATAMGQNVFIHARDMADCIAYIERSICPKRRLDESELREMKKRLFDGTQTLIKSASCYTECFRGIVESNFSAIMRELFKED